MSPNTPPRRPAEPIDLIRSVSRALRVLEEVARAGRPLPVKAVARRTELNLSTAYHLVRTLSFEGYLLRTPGGDYTIGPGVAERFHDLVHALRRPPQAHVVLAQLSARTGHSAYLARFVDGRLVVADVVEGPQSPYLEDLQIGLDAAAHATAIGKALLGTMTTPQRRRRLAELGMRPFTANTPTEPEQVEAELVAPRRAGVIVEHGQFRAGVSCAAAALPDADAGDHWAIGVSGRVDALPEPVLWHLRTAVREMTVAINGPDAPASTGNGGVPPSTAPTPDPSL